MKYAYEHIADDMLRKIRSGEWKEGDQLPALNELEGLYPQSRMTLYRALCHLSERGYISMERGRGTFVKTAHTRQRVGIIASTALFTNSVAPFAFQAFRHAHAFFATCSMDSQLYAEDPLAPSGLPAGLLEELDRKKLAGLLSIDAECPCRHMRTTQWSGHAVPHVHIGATAAPHRVYVDRDAFLDRALVIARESGRRRVMLLEKPSHLADHYDLFLQRCAEEGLTPCAYPSPMPPSTLAYEDFGYDLMHRVWQNGDRPDAVIVPDDVITKGISQGALALGIRMPDELMIIAMTNRGARMFYPVPVTPLEVDVEALVAIAARMLIDQINGMPAPPQSILVPPAPAHI